MSYKKSILHSLGHFNDVFDYFFFHRWIIWKKHLRNLIGAIRGKTRTHRIFVLKNPQQFQPRICLECKCLKTWRSDYTPYDWYTISNLIPRRLMARTNQEAVTAFGEVLRSANVPGSYNSQNNRMAANDNRLMIYFQGMKVYIPDNFQPDTLLKLLQTLKKLWWSVLQKEPPGFSLPADYPNIRIMRSHRFLKTDPRTGCYCQSQLQTGSL